MLFGAMRAHSKNAHQSCYLQASQGRGLVYTFNGPPELPQSPPVPPGPPASAGALGPHGVRLHRFCAGGKAFDLCQFDIPRFSYPSGYAGGAPNFTEDGKGADCLELSALVTEDKALCDNWEQAFELLLHPSLPLVKFWIEANSMIGVRESFPVIGQWSQGTDSILGEFHGDFYKLRELAMPDGECFIDIGANIGMFSVLVPHIFKNVHGNGFEAQPLNFLLLHQNLAENQLLDRVTPHNAALNSNNEALAIDYDPINPGGNIAAYQSQSLQAEEWARQGERRFLTPGLTVSDALKMCGVEGKVVMKIDCEHCEYAVWPALYANRDRFRMLRGEIHEAGIGDFKDGRAIFENMTAFFKERYTKRGSAISRMDEQFS